MNTIISKLQPQTRLLEFVITSYGSDLQTIIDETRVFAVSESEAKQFREKIIADIHRVQDRIVGRTEIEQVGQDTEFPRPINSAEEDYINDHYFRLDTIQQHATVFTTRGGTIFSLLGLETSPILLAEIAMSMVITQSIEFGSRGEPTINIERIPAGGTESFPAYYEAYCLKHELLFSLERDKCEECGYITCSCPGQQLTKL